MSVMRTPEAVPSRIVGVARFLLSCREGRELQSKVEAMMSPPTLKNAPGDSETSSTSSASETMIRKVIRECVAMNLCSSQDGVLILSEVALQAFPKKQFDSEKMRALLWQLILDSSSNANEDLGLVLTWFMEQDPMNFGLGKGDRRASLMAELRQQTGAEQLQITNNSPADNFSYWAVYLGLGWKMSLGTSNSERLVPDPTPFLSRYLTELMSFHDPVPILTFLERLAEFCPVFRGSRWHSTLEQKGALPNREAQFIPPTLEFAFRRLEEKQQLKLIFQSDADALLLRSEGQNQNLSHLQRLL